MTLALAACASAPPATTTATTAKPEVAATGAPAPSGPNHVLSLRGSNTLGVAYAPKLVKAFLARKGATHIVDHDEKRAKETLWISADLGGTPLWVEINTPGTKSGFQSLVKGYCDVVLASRPITDDEVYALRDYGDLSAPASESVVAMDGIAVITHPNSPVDHLTTAQLEQIFSGKVKNWSQVGGPEQTIHVMSRDTLSGTHDAFMAMAMHGKAIKAERWFEDSEELAHAVQSTEGAIGYVGLPYVKQTKALAIQDGAARALFPTQFTVATEDYALSRRLFFYTPAAPKDPLTRELVEFALSDEGQAIVGDAGFVPLSLRSEAAQVPKDAPQDYAKLANGATRLSLDFRFKLNSASIDTKGLHDLDRLTRYLASPVNRGRHLALAGFADAQGAETINATLAKQRAEAIAQMLKDRGIAAVEIASFGSALPVAPNETAEGRARNRRVEAWLR